MNKTKSRAADEAAVAAGLSHGRRLGNLLRDGASEKRARMLNELRERTASRDASTLARSLATCADASLGDDFGRSSDIRAAAGGFRDAIVAHPPDGRRDWEAIADTLAENDAKEAVTVPGTAEATCASASTAMIVAPSSDDEEKSPQLPH